MTRRHRGRLAAAWGCAGVLVLAACSAGSSEDDAVGSLGGGGDSPQPDTRTAGPVTIEPRPGALRPRVVRTVATGLEVPWGLAFLTDGTALVSERDSGRIVAIDPDTGDVREVGRLSETRAQGEAGLLGLAVPPEDGNDADGEPGSDPGSETMVYAYVSTDADNRVMRMPYDGRQLGAAEPVLTGIPNGFIHDGGRMVFAADGTLFVATGEIGEPELAQDRDSLGGKILRITPEGEPARGNPVPGSEVWSMGHRNVQGLAFDERGRLWATEFGSNVWDELNRIDKGSNYGWPRVEGEGDIDAFRNPFVTWATGDASPSGLAYARGSLWAAALRGERLWQVPLQGSGTGRPRDWFVGDYGRLRTVTVAPNGNLWVTTSNRDGRGDPTGSDDRILEIELS